MAESSDLQVRALRTEVQQLRRQLNIQDDQIHTLIPQVRLLQNTLKVLIKKLGPDKNAKKPG